MKKRVAILYSGQIRNNGLGDVCDQTVLESTKKHLLNNGFLEKYDYDVFISVDKIDLDKTFQFFGRENVKNVHFLETGYYLHPIQNNIPELNYFDNKFKSLNFHGFNSYPEQFYQYYRLYDAYNLLLNSGNQYDYIVKLRPDLLFLDDIMKLFHLIENTEIKMIMEHNLFWICKSDFNIIPTLVENYGSYSKCHDLSLYYFYDPFIWSPHRYCSEVQVANCIFEYCIERNLNIRTTLLGTVFGTYIKLDRK